MKKFLLFFLAAVAAQAQFQPSTVSCQGSNWTGYHWQLCVDQVTAGNPVNICNSPAGCHVPTDWSVVGSNGGTGIFSMLTVTGSAFFGSTGTLGSITFGDSSTGTTVLSSPPTANGTLLVNGTAIPSGGPFAPIASPTFTGVVTIPSTSILGTPASVTLTNATGLPNAGLLHPSTTVNGQTCTLGSSCSISTGGNFNGYGMWQLTVPTLSTWLNQGGASLVSGTNFQAISAPAGSSCCNVRILHQTAGTAPWDWYGLITFSGAYGNSDSAGLVIDDGTKLVTFGCSGYGGAGTGRIAAYNWTNTTTYSGSLAVTSTYPCESTATWFRIHNDGTNLTLSYSSNGITFTNITSAFAITTYLTAATNIGIYAECENSVACSVAAYALQGTLTAQ